jgi:stearoyl-CoA desaturase (delta-9 desaturase)
MIVDETTPPRVKQFHFDFARGLPFLLVHLACFGVLWTGASWVAVGVCFALYVIRMFAITGGYHRYFSHRSYKTSRVFQLIIGVVGAAAVQRGPLWWAANHRHHHRYSDQPEDVHSPILHGIWHSHIGWITTKEWYDTRYGEVKDLARHPELRFLNQHDLVVPMLLALACYCLGAALEICLPGLKTTPMQMVMWGFFISTVLLYHGTFCINSFCHLIGSKRYKTGDESRNSLLLALITLGEGWHNNHHYYPGAERQGHYWWEIDITHYGLRALSWAGLVWDLHATPESVKRAGLLRAAASQPIDTTLGEKNSAPAAAPVERELQEQA